MPITLLVVSLVGLCSLCIMALLLPRSDSIVAPVVIVIYLITIYYAIVLDNSDKGLSVESTKTTLPLGQESHSVIIGPQE